MAEAQQLPAQLAQAVGRDVAQGRGEAGLLHHLADRLDGAGGADGHVPAQLAIGLGNARQLLPGRGQRAFEVARGDLAVGKKAGGIAHAAHVQRFGGQRLEAVADDEFGGAAADVDHQPPAVAGLGVGHAEIDQAGLLAAGNHLDGVVQYLFGAFQEGLGVLGHAQRIGADHAQVGGIDTVQVPCEAGQAGQCARLGLVGQAAAVVEAGAELHLLRQPLQELDLAMVEAGDGQMETVGTQVDSGHEATLAQTGGRCHSLISGQRGRRRV